MDCPIYAFFRHDDGSWYRLWATHSETKTKGERWHVHATYDKSGTLAPIAATAWYEQPYGMHNWDFEREDEAVKAFRKRFEDRLRHGYRVAESSSSALEIARDDVITGKGERPERRDLL